MSLKFKKAQSKTPWRTELFTKESVSLRKLIKTRKDFNMSKQLLEIKDLFVTAGEKEILKGINLTVNKGETHVIMGPNGSRKNHNRKCHFK